MQLSQLNEKNRLKSFPVLRMFSERRESDRVPWSQFVASLCFLLEFSKFLLHSQRLVNAALAHHSQLHHMFPSGNFHRLLDQRWNSSQPLMSSPCHHPQVLKAAFFFFFILQTIPRFRITLFFFFALYLPSLQMCFIPGMEQSDITNLSGKRRLGSDLPLGSPGISSFFLI